MRQDLTSKIKITITGLIFLGTVVIIGDMMLSTVLQRESGEGNINQVFVTTSPRAASSPTSSDPIGDEWPMFHGALNHTGVTTTTPAQGSAPFWSYSSIDKVSSSPAVSGGRVFVGNWYGLIYCLNASTGAFMWSFNTGTFILSSPAVAGDRVFVGSYDHNVYCLNATTGAKLWNYTTGERIYSSPVVSSGYVYVGSLDHNVYCLNANTGTKLWNYTTGGEVPTSPAIAGGRLYVGSYDAKLYCLNPANGAIFWSYTTLNWLISSPAVANGRVYFGCYDSKLYCVYATNGSFAWSRKTGAGVQSSPAITGGMVYVGTTDNKLCCYNAITGAPVWNYTTTGAVTSSPAVAGGRVYVGCDDYHIYSIYATNGSLIWSYATGNGVASSPAIAGGRVYIGCSDNRIYCLPMILLPSAPRNLVATPGNLHVSLSWLAPLNTWGSAITNYRIYRGTVSNGETLVTTIGNVLTYNNTGLTNGQVYYFKVAAVNGVGIGANSTEASATPRTVPTAPTLSSATPGNAQAVLVWTTPGNNGGSAITNYRIYVGTTSGGETLNMTVGGSILTVGNFTGLRNGLTYYFQVAAVNVAGVGALSNELNAMPKTVPTAPIGLTLTPKDSRVELNWATPASNGGSAITGYNVYRGTTSGGETLLANLGNVLTYNNTGLTNGQIYYYKVAAVNVVGIGANTTEASATPATVPSAPTGLSATSGNTQIILNWTAPASNGGSPLTGYRIYQGTSSNGEVLLTTVGAVLTYTSTGLTNAKVYYFKVAAVNVMGNGTNSTEASAMPIGSPTAPLACLATAGDAQITITWQVPANYGGSPINNYRIYRGRAAGGENLYLTVANLTAVTDWGVQQGITYYYQVSAMNGKGEGLRSTETSAMIPAALPGAPQSLTLIAGSGFVLLSWQVPASNGGAAISGYKIYRGTAAGAEIYYTITGNITSFTDTAVTSGQAYYYIVCAVNCAGDGPQSSAVSAVPLAATSGSTDTMDLALGIAIAAMGIAISSIVIAFALHLQSQKQTNKLARDFREVSKKSGTKKGSAGYVDSVPPVTDLPETRGGSAPPSDGEAKPGDA